MIFRRRDRTNGSPDFDPLRAVIDAGAGRIDRRHETDDEFDAFTRAAGAHPEVQILSNRSLLAGELVDEFDVRWSSMGYTFDEDAIYHRFVHLCGDEPTLAERRVEDVLEADNRALEAYAVDVTIDEPFLRIDMSESHADALERSSTAGVTYPQITWGARTSNDGTRLELSHEGGDEVDAARLTVWYGSGPGGGTDPEPQFDDEFATVEPGDSLAVDVDDRPQGDPVTVGYSPRESGSSTVLLRVDPE